MMTDTQEARSIEIGGKATILRPMARGDAEEIMNFAQAMPAHDLLFLQRDIRQPRVIQAWLDQLESGQIRSTVALRDGHIIACTALVRDEFSWSAHVCEIRILIAPESRSTGIGRILATQCVADARETGVKKLFVRMTPDQSGALRVFEDLGFTPEALLRDHVCDASGTEHDIAILALNVGRQMAQHRLYGMEGAPDQG
jgi:N-acetylglutamate synthase-like GNAT family acetyltransferase